jgi:Ribbon-helix-helix protein, copG family
VGYFVGMRLHINLDEDLVKQIDEVAGPRGRSRLIREAVEAEVERRHRRAALERLFGSMPDFAPWMTPEWISENRKRESGERDRKIEGYWRRPLD